MEHYASEQEQVDQIKRWWKENGKSLIVGLVLGVGGLAGYRYWDANQTATAENASYVYEQFLQMTRDQRLDDALTTGQAILDNYPNSIYARLSTLMLARIALDTGDTGKAKTLLQGLVASKDADAQITRIARARLARILLAEGDSVAAAAMIGPPPASDDGERFAELRGDILAANGDLDAARSQYLQALAQAETLGLERGAIQLKLDNLAAGAAQENDS